MAHLRRARGGNITFLFAASVLPLVLIGGGSLDLAAGVTDRQKAQAALDAAALSAAKSFVVEPDDLKTMVQGYMAASLGSDLGARVENLTVSVEGSRLTAKALVRRDTVFMAAMGTTSLSMPIQAEIVRNVKKIELALVLDNTGSMAGSGKIAALREAARELVVALYAGENAGENMKVAVVPYVTAVNINGDGFDMAWMDVNAQSTHHGENFSPRANHFDLFADMGVEWKGCVEMRAEPYDTSDTAPNAEFPDTLFTPYLWPDEPEDQGSGNWADFDNDYIFDDEDHCASCAGLSGEALRIAQQADTTKYAAVASLNRLDDSPSTTWGPNKSCARPILPLSNDDARILAEIDAMEPWNNSGTNGAAGLAWGWRVLSPGAPYTQGVGYEDATVQKAIVMMTDGENTIYGGWDSPNRSNYSSYGYLSQDRLGTQSQGTAKTRVNEKMTELCNAIKAEGILLFTVTFKLNSSALKETYRNCASAPEYYFDSGSNGAIVEHFLAIAGELSELRVAR